jgi:putative tricarboxylic transport membrane protein
MSQPKRISNAPALVVGLGLILVAVVTAWDASTIGVRAGYGIGPEATSYLIAVLVAVLGVAHLPTALRSPDSAAERADWRAVGWVGLALASLILVIAFNGGFIFGSALLFVFTARAFGRRGFAADLAIGLALAFLIFLLFNKLLSLTLPMGPIERLI